MANQVHLKKRGKLIHKNDSEQTDGCVYLNLFKSTQSVTQHPESSPGECYKKNWRCHRAICLEANCLFKLLAILNQWMWKMPSCCLLYYQHLDVILLLSACFYSIPPPPPPQSCFTEVCLFFGYMTEIVWHFEGTSEWIFTQDNSVKQVQMVTSVQKKKVTGVSFRHFTQFSQIFKLFNTKR